VPQRPLPPNTRLLPAIHRQGHRRRTAGPETASSTWSAGQAIVAERDLQFGYLGLQTLYDRYFLHIRTRIEMPQAFYMRVAMGLALNEIDREARAIEFYNLLSSFDFMSSTPTLFNSAPCARSCRRAT
jgi:ribonucleotide reductase alpha subunit